MASFELTSKGPFSLEASSRFLEGFAPADYEGASDEGHLHLAFVPDNAESAVGVCLRSTSANGRTIEGETFGVADTEDVAEQVERILSLDVDGTGFTEVGSREPVVGGLQERYPGLRPVGFLSPYEAASWAIIGQRVRIVQAAKTKTLMAERLGEEVNIHGERMHAFPSPQRLQNLEAFPGLWGSKVENLKGIAEATLDGRLDAAYLRSLPTEEALAKLKELRGIGDFSAELVLLRGAGEPDHLSIKEPRLRRAVAIAYGLDHEPDTEELRKISEGWRPYRTWVTLLLRTMLEDETNEIRGRSR